MEIYELSPEEMFEVAGGQGRANICGGAAIAAAGLAEAAGVPAVGSGILGLAVGEACNSALSGGAPGGDTAGYGNGSADGNGGGGQVGGDGA
jgi:hypothetical protein